jgi:hypothetical protein
MKLEDLENINKIIFDSQSYLLEKIRHHNCEIENLRIHYDKAIQQLEFKLTSAYDEINTVYSSPRYLTGRLILSPFIILKKMLRLI